MKQSKKIQIPLTESLKRDLLLVSLNIRVSAFPVSGDKKSGQQEKRETGELKIMKQ